ncbi:MAG: ABC transporter ATP-binding protein [Bacteriovoracaceae bacterium]|nr:ABC transporter ATP-binding protein [Bacteriovoracaceae bacterium]
MEPALVISAKKICKTYGDLTVLNKVDINIQKGNFYALLGHNGAGKSTLLKILAGQEYYNKGEIEIFGKKLDGHLKEVKNLIGHVSEQINYNVPLSVGEFFINYSKLYKLWNEGLFQDLISRQSFDLSRPFNEFSRGQKMQIALIAALAIEPELLLVDEVTSVFDVCARNFYIKLLKDFCNRGGTVVMTTNVIEEIQNNATDTIILTKGNILLNTPSHQAAQDLVKVRKTKENEQHDFFKMKQLFWVGTNSDFTESYIFHKKECVDKKEYLSFIDAREITLNEVFMFYTLRQE